MQACGYKVLTATDGEFALRVFSEAPQAIQLVISDVIMPGLQGPQLVRSIKHLSPSTAALLMSGSWTVYSEDGVPLIRKPFTRQKLVTMVRYLLKACDFAKIEAEQSLIRSQRLAAASGIAASQSAETHEHPRAPAPFDASVNAVPDLTKVI
jgi:DNA-binding NtrC family response regulator